MEPQSILLALLLGVLAWRGRSRPSTARRRNRQRPTPPVKPPPPTDESSVEVRAPEPHERLEEATEQRPATSVAVLDHPPAPAAPPDEVDEVDVAVPPAPAAPPDEVDEVDVAVPPAPAADPTPSEPAASLTPTTSAANGRERPYGAGSARSLPDGSPPGPDYTIKGNEDSMLFHPPTSPYYKRTKAEVWFRTAADARAAGFIEWTPRRRTKR
ncbi:MAG: hypothetical protein ACR2GH_01530 [Pseudonocardia sp.]